MIKEKQVREMLKDKLFSGQLPADFVEFCLAHGRIRHYAPKQFLYLSGETGDTVYFLIKGRVRLDLMSEFSEKIIRVLNSPTFFPEIILDEKPYPHSALCLEKADILTLSCQILRQYLESNPSLLWIFYRELALDLRRSYRQIKNLSLGDARLRLGAKLYALAHVHGQSSSKGIQISIPLSTTELAGMCSLARESVSRILGELKEINMIEIEKKNITVHDLESLSHWIHERSARSHSTLA